MGANKNARRSTMRVSLFASLVMLEIFKDSILWHIQPDMLASTIQLEKREVTAKFRENKFLIQ